MLLFIQILTIAVVSFALECPPTDKVNPCSCGEDAGIILITCEGFSGIDEIEPVIKNTIGYNVSFKFLRSYLGDIPSDLFEGHKSVTLRFEHSLITSFADTPFRELENTLESLHIYFSVDKSAITSMDAFKISHLKKLKYFYFAYNDFDEVGNHWFEGGPETLLQVNLYSNKIEKFGDRALASLVNLQQLYLGDNKIKAVARSMVPNPMKDLYLLDIQSNEIEELPSDAFDGYPRLQKINLSKNKLNSIPENVWSKIWSQLQEVYLDGNEIVCDENLKWIYKQKLPTTFVGKCGPGNALHNKDLNSLKLEDFQ